MIIKRKDASDTSAYLRQFETHEHSFSRCVLAAANSAERSDETGEQIHWTRTIPSLDEKIDFIISRLKGTFQAALRKGVRVIAFTEHPQYARYGVTYERYKWVFNMLRMQYEAFIDRILWGLELDLEVVKDRRPFVNEEIIGNAAVGPKEEFLENAEVLIGSLHLYHAFKDRKESLPKDQRDRIIEYEEAEHHLKSREDYLELTVSAIEALGEFRCRIEPVAKNLKAVVYGHPWGAAWLANKRWYEIDDARGESKGKWIPLSDPQYQEFLDTYLWTPNAKIQFFTREQLETIADALIRNRIYPEVNLRYIERGASEYCSRWKGETLMDAYLARCKHHGVIPYISVGSDAHSPAELQRTDWKEIIDRVPAISMAPVWAEEIS